jgi:hypothetical protein
VSKLWGLLIPLAVCLLLVAGCSFTADRSSGAASGMGDLPSFLPTPTSNGVVRGSAASPAMSYPGSPVTVELATGHVTVDVAGPSIPPDTKLNADQVLATFTITLRDADTTVSVTASQFDVLDHNGGVHPLTPSASVPPQADPHQNVTFALYATLPSGEGLLRYHPTASAVVAAWDYVAETD